MLPGKKGISMNIDNWEQIKKYTQLIDLAFKEI